MKLGWIVFVAGAALSWGAYVPTIHHGQLGFGGPNKALRAFLFVGLAYFLAAVIVPAIWLKASPDGASFTGRGAGISTLAGILGAAGALCVIFALKSGGNVVSRDKAQVELDGVILSYATVPVSYTSQDTIKEYQVVIKVQATLQEPQTRKVLWKDEISESQSFPVNENLALQQNAEEAAAAKICRRISEDIWRKIGEAF